MRPLRAIGYDYDQLYFLTSIGQEGTGGIFLKAGKRDSYF
jgi:hypothetical protein